jgi:hypothetical protein
MQMVASFRIFFWFLCFPISRVIHTLFNWVVYYCYVFFVTQIHICMYNVWVLCDEYNSVFCFALLYVLHCCEVMLVICIVIFLDEWMIFSPTPAVRFGWRIAFLKTKSNRTKLKPHINSQPTNYKLNSSQILSNSVHDISHARCFSLSQLQLLLHPSHAVISLAASHSQSLTLSNLNHGFTLPHVLSIKKRCIFCKLIMQLVNLNAISKWKWLESGFMFLQFDFAIFCFCNFLCLQFYVYAFWFCNIVRLN